MLGLPRENHHYMSLFSLFFPLVSLSSSLSMYLSIHLSTQPSLYACIYLSFHESTFLIRPLHLNFKANSYSIQHNLLTFISTSRSCPLTYIFQPHPMTLILSISWGLFVSLTLQNPKFGPGNSSMVDLAGLWIMHLKALMARFKSAAATW